MRAVIVALLLSVGVVSAQAPQAPALDQATRDLFYALFLSDQALASAVQARVDAMLKTDEGKAYQAELGKRQGNQKAINTTVGQKFPGWQMDFASGKLVPIKVEK